MLDHDLFTKLLRSAVRDEDPMGSLKTRLRELGVTDCQVAMSALADLADEFPSNLMSRFYAVFGELLQNRLDFHGAVDAYRKSLGHREYFYSRLGLVECHAMLRDKAAVLSEITQIDISQVPSSASVAHLMIASARVGAFDVADALFDRAIKQREDVFDLYFARAKCEFVKGNPVASREIALRYIAEVADRPDRKEFLRREFAMNDDYVEFEYAGKNIVMIYPEFHSDQHRKERSCFGELSILEYIREHYPVHGVIVDIGCHVGNHSRYFQEFLKLDYIIGFDAARNAGAYYCRNVRDAIFYNVPLGRAGEEIELYGDIINHRFGQSGVAVGNQALRPESRVVTTRSLDEFALRNVSLIKIDVEGWELPVLEGAAATLNGQHPLVLMEVFRDNRARYDQFINKSMPGYRVVKTFGDTSLKKHDILLEYGVT